MEFLADILIEALICTKTETILTKILQKFVFCRIFFDFFKKFFVFIRPTNRFNRISSEKSGNGGAE